MTTTLNSNNFIPLNSNDAYSTATYNYTASTVASIPNSTIVDWVLVELRTGTAAGTKVATRAGFLKSDGTIVDIDGTSPVLFTGLSAGNYYIVLRHRNHLAIMSAAAIPLSSSSALYNFTTGNNKFYGGGAKSLEVGIFGMIGGDTYSDGFIDILDFVGPDNENFLDGYRNSDSNMDGFVDIIDFISPDNNNFFGSTVP